MNLEEYERQQAIITTLFIKWLGGVINPFIRPSITPSQWLQLLELIFIEVQARRGESARLARRFYDDERFRKAPFLERNDTDLVGSSFEEFVKQMEPARKRMSLANSPNDAKTRFLMQAVREVENAGRREIIQAVNTDKPLVDYIVEEQRVAERATLPRLPEGQRLIRGWARVATGRETCAWCLMLISRGPVYYEADRAGLTYDEQLALQLYQKTKPEGLGSYFDEIEDLMEEWHPNCDCKVVPVFKKEDWPGYPAQQRAEDLWVQAADEAKAWRKQYPDRVHLTGENAGKKFTFNEDQILALRRMIARGEINFNELRLAA